MDANTLFTWEALATMGGASLLTFFIVSYTKELITKKIPTDLYAVLVATVVLVLANIATGANALDWKVYVLSIANAFIVAAAAGQMNNKVINPPKIKDNGDTTTESK